VACGSRQSQKRGVIVLFALAGALVRVAALLALAACFLAAPARAQGVSPNQMFGCNQQAIYDNNTNGTTKLVTGVANKQVYICGWNIMPAGTVAVQFVYGTGGTCAVGQTVITPAFQLTAQIAEIDHLPVYTGITPAPASNDVCIKTNAGIAVQAILYYTQF